MSKKSLKTFLESVPVVTRIPMKPNMFTFGHLNNCEYFRFQESAMHNYHSAMCAEINAIDPERVLGFDDAAFINGTGHGPIIAETHCKFKFAVTFPDVLLVGSTVTSLAADRFVMQHTCWSLRHERVVSTGAGIIVTVDYSKEGKKCDIHPALPKGIESLEKRDSGGALEEFQVFLKLARFE